MKAKAKKAKREMKERRYRMRRGQGLVFDENAEVVLTRKTPGCQEDST